MAFVAVVSRVTGAIRLHVVLNLSGPGCGGVVGWCYRPLVMVVVFHVRPSCVQFLAHYQSTERLEAFNFAGFQYPQGVSCHRSAGLGNVVCQNPVRRSSESSRDIDCTRQPPPRSVGSTYQARGAGAQRRKACSAYHPWNV